MSSLKSNIDETGTEADLETFVKRLEMAKVTYGTIIKRSRNYLDDIEKSVKKPYLLMVDRYLLSTRENLKNLELQQNEMFYGHLNNDDVLISYKEELEFYESELLAKRQALKAAGYENSLIKFLPESNRFTDLD